MLPHSIGNPDKSFLTVLIGTLQISYSKLFPGFTGAEVRAV